MRVRSRLVAAVLLTLTAGCAPVVPQVDPAGTGWTVMSTAPLSARHEAAGVWTGEVFLVVGGSSDNLCPPSASCAPPADPPLRDGAAYDPVRRTWRKLPDAPVPVSAWGRTVEVRGSLYLLTYDVGRADSPQTMLRFDPASDVWEQLPLPPAPATAQLVAAGERLVAVAGSADGHAARDAWFDESSRRWRSLPRDPLGRSDYREAVWTSEGLLLAAGDVTRRGSANPPVVRLARLDPSWQRWTSLGPAEVIGGSPVAVDGLVVWPMRGSADGGEVNNWGRSYPMGGILDPATMAWRRLPAAPTSSTSARGLVGYLATAGDSLLVDGQLLRPSTSAWTTVPAGPWRAQSSQTVIGSDRFLMVWGGSTYEENTNEGYLLRVE